VESSPTTTLATAPPHDGTGPAPRTATDLLALSQLDLYELFRRSSAGQMPEGTGRGVPILLPGTSATKPAARVLGTIAWRGKVFRRDSGDLKNLITPLGIRAIRAEVSRQPSWFDGQECIVLDYTRSSRVAGWIRDEIREVSPGLYLGFVYGVGRVFGGRRLLDVGFTLTFPPASAAS
jgi:hypothetical protein